MDFVTSKQAPPTLSIGPLSLSLSAATGVTLEAWPAVYDPFMAAVAGLADTERMEMALRVESGSLPGLLEARPVFDAQGTWALLRGEGTRFIVHAPEGLARARWAAALPEAMTSATVSVAADPALPAGVRRWPLQYPLDQVLIMYRCAQRGHGVLVHAAGLEVDGRLYLLAGRSGAGKSTLSRLLVQAGLGRVLNDDRLLLWRHAAGPMGYSTPWPGTERIARQASAPLAAILFLEHGTDNTFHPLAPRAALEALLPLLSMLWFEPDLAARQLDVAAALVADVPACRWSFTPDAGALHALARFRP